MREEDAGPELRPRGSKPQEPLLEGVPAKAERPERGEAGSVRPQQEGSVW